MFALSTFCESGDVALLSHFSPTLLFCMDADQAKPASVIPSGISSRRSFERNIAQPPAAALATWTASGSLSPSFGPSRAHQDRALHRHDLGRGLGIVRQLDLPGPRDVARLEGLAGRGEPRSARANEDVEGAVGVA